MKEKQVSRRRFLEVAALAAAPWFVPASALGRGGFRPAGERINVAMFGVGNMGGIHTNNMVQLADAQIVAVCDPFEERRSRWAAFVDNAYADQRARAGYKGVVPYNDFRHVLKRDDIDAVVVSTPDHWHVPLAVAAVHAGKAVYVEKPLGLSIEQNRILREAVHRYGAIFQYGTQQRCLAHCRLGCELVLNGRIGDVKSIEVVAPGGESGGSITPVPPPAGFDYDLWLGPAPFTPYTADRCTPNGSYHVYDNSIGYLGGWGAHPLDILDWAWGVRHGIPVEYEGNGVIPTHGLFSAVKDWDMRCRYANGVEMTFKSGGTFGSDSTKFIGTEGWVDISRGRLLTEPASLQASIIPPNGIHLLRSTWQEQNFLDGVRTGSPPISDVDSAFRSDAISHLCDIAVRCARPIRWDPKSETIVGDEIAARRLSRPMRAPWHFP